MGSTYPAIQGTGKSPQSVTVDLEALKGLFVNHSADGMTVMEISEATGSPPGRVRKLIKQGVLAGKVTVGRRWVEDDWDGKNRTYTVYAMVDTE